MTKPTVAVIGASGNTGKPTVTNLLKHKDKVNVIAIGRTKEKLLELEKKGANIMLCPTFDETDLVPTLKGVDRLWFTAPNPSLSDKAFDRIKLAKRVIDAAKKAKVSFLVFAGFWGSEHESTTFAKEFRDLEKYMEASGIPYCGLRMTPFIENIVGSRDLIKQGKFPRPLPIDQGFTQISVEDIGAFSAEILVDGPNKYMNKYFDLTGEVYSTKQIASILSKIFEKEIKPIEMSHEEYKKSMTGSSPPYQINGLLELYDLFRKGKATSVNPIFKEIVGRDYLSMEKRLRDLHTMKFL